MSESLSSSYDISQMIYTDLKSAFELYQYGSERTLSPEEEAEIKKYTSRAELTRLVHSELQKFIEKRNEAAQKRRAEQETEKQQTNTQLQTDNKKFELPEVKTYTLPKSSQTIVSELKRNGFRSMLTPYNVAEEYGIGYMQARQILDEVNKDKNGFVREFNLPQNSTISYKV